MFTKPHKNYISPSREEMREKCQAAGIPVFSPTLLGDLANLASGGEILPSHVWEKEIKKVCIEKYPVSVQEWEIEQGVKRGRLIVEFLRELKWDGVPGNSPLAKGISLLASLKKEKRGEEGSFGEFLPVFDRGDGGKTNSTWSDVENLEQEEKELLDSDDSLEGKRKAAEKLANGAEKILEISRKLESLTKMKVSKSRKWIPDPSGSEIRQRPIKGVDELAKIKQASFTLPKSILLLKAATGALQVRERGEWEVKKQILYLICDCSGSMDKGNRIKTALGIVMNRIKAVMKGDAELIFRFFDSSLKEEKKIFDREEAKKIFPEISESGNFSGGSTAIASCAKQAAERIRQIQEEFKGLDRPELVIITDGDDDCSSLNKKDFEGIRVHAFVVEKNNRELTDFAESTGGVGIGNLK